MTILQTEHSLSKRRHAYHGLEIQAN